MKTSISSSLALSAVVFIMQLSCTNHDCRKTTEGHSFNGPYSGRNLDRISFPIGGIGAGMFCMDGTGSISHLSVNNKPEVFNEPVSFAALSIKGVENGSKVLEAQVPEWKLYGPGGSGNGSPGKLYGLPRFEKGSFLPRFPFATLTLSDDDIPFSVEVTGWSPFIPAEEDNSSLPVGAFEYKFRNNTSQKQEAVFSWNSRNILVEAGGPILETRGGFIMSANVADRDMPGKTGFAVFTDDPAAIVDYCWFRGEWFDPYMMLWKNIESCSMPGNPVSNEPVMGASVYVPFILEPGMEKTVTVYFCWYQPSSGLSIGNIPGTNIKLSPYTPWYAGRFKELGEVIEYWRNNYPDLRRKSALFRDAFYSSTLPQEVLEAVAANLTILKSPTVLRQQDGRLWGWEGCSDNEGCCPGSCTHVWNYAQAIPHLFPALERSLRETEFLVSQNEMGHQNFRVNLPVSEPPHNFHAAADGQLGGIMKIYRDWRISGDTEWMKGLYVKVKSSLEYCIGAWDPGLKGIIEEPHHNTYDIEFWGPNGMCTSFYLGALTAIIEMSKALNEPYARYDSLLTKGKDYMENELFDGEYFIQNVKWEGLRSPNPVEAARSSYRTHYTPEALELLKQEGPKYQYGSGCLSDGVIGMWMSSACGLREAVDNEKVKSHLLAVHKYNLRDNLIDHVNPQRSTYAAGKEGGLLLCTWPKGGKLSLPFIYSNEIWTGIEYQVASHLMFKGEVEKGLDIVRKARNRYNGSIRNPFNEYECGSWYARAMSSYAMLEGLTGVRYDAVEKTLYIDSRIGNFKSFLSTATGFGNVGLKNGDPYMEVAYGNIDVKRVLVSGYEMKLKQLD